MSISFLITPVKAFFLIPDNSKLDCGPELFCHRRVFCQFCHLNRKNFRKRIRTLISTIQIIPKLKMSNVSETQIIPSIIEHESWSMMHIISLSYDAFTEYVETKILPCLKLYPLVQKISFEIKQYIGQLRYLY